jgi:hypothetical protein
MGSDGARALMQRHSTPDERPSQHAPLLSSPLSPAPGPLEGLLAACRTHPSITTTTFSQNSILIDFKRGLLTLPANYVKDLIREREKGIFCLIRFCL